MKYDTKLSLKTLTVASLLIYWISVICFEFIYPYVASSKVLAFLLFISVLMGAIVAIASLRLKNNSIWQAILRLVTLLFGFIFWTILNGYTGTIRYLQRIFDINTKKSTDNASGMLMLTFYLSIFTVCILTILTWYIFHALRKRISSKGK